MRIKDTDIPQSAIDAGRAAMVDGFVANQIQAAVSAVLRTDPGFTYPDARPSAMTDLDMRVGDRLIQNARKDGTITFANKRWAVAAKA